MSWRESSPIDRELTREEIEQMHTAKEEKIQAVETKIQTKQAELSILENRLPRLEDQIRRGDQFTSDHLSEHAQCPYGGHTVDRINDLEWKAGEVRSTIFFKGKKINDLQFELYKLREEKAGLLRLF